MKTFKQFLKEGGKYNLNIAVVPLDKARSYAEEQFIMAGKNLDDVLLNFDRNYIAIQKATKHALDIPRIDMPVIEPLDIEKFSKDLIKGNVDIFKPYTFDNKYFPKHLRGSDRESKEFLTLG